MTFSRTKRTDSDTITVTPDGRIVVDARKLMEKDHIQATLRDIRSKTKYQRIGKQRTVTPVEAAS